MKTERQFVAHYVTSGQITEDQWVRINRTLIVTESTTIGEIRKWVMQKQGEGIMDIHITENSPIQP